MSEMIERVARAIEAQMETSDNYPQSFARAAIEAMREPTQEQYDALSATDKMWRELNSRTVWQTYIDAALEE